MTLITSRNKITHALKTKPRYHCRYSVATCGAKIGRRLRKKGRRCKRCFPISLTHD